MSLLVTISSGTGDKYVHERLTARSFMKCLIIVVAMLSTPPLVTQSQTNDTAVVNEYIAKQARREAGEEYKEARKILTGDLNHDRKPDLAVLYTIESQH